MCTPSTRLLSQHLSEREPEIPVYAPRYASALPSPRAHLSPLASANDATPGACRGLDPTMALHRPFPGHSSSAPRQGCSSPLGAAPLMLLETRELSQCEAPPALRRVQHGGSQRVSLRGCSPKGGSQSPVQGTGARGAPSVPQCKPAAWAHPTHARSAIKTPTVPATTPSPKQHWHPRCSGFIMHLSFFFIFCGPRLSGQLWIRQASLLHQESHQDLQTQYLGAQTGWLQLGFIHMWALLRDQALQIPLPGTLPAEVFAALSQYLLSQMP